MCLHRRVGRLETGLGAQPFGHVRLLAAGQPPVVPPGGVTGGQPRRLQPGRRLGQRERDALVLPDGTAEDDPFAGVPHRRVEGRTADAQRLVGQQDPLGVQPVEQIPEALPLLADPPGGGHPQPVQDDLVGGDRVPAHLGDGPQPDGSGVQIGQEEGHAVGRLGHLLARGGAGDEDDHLRLTGLGDPHLAAVDDVVVAVPPGDGEDPRRVRPRVGFGDAEADVQRAVGGAGQDLPPQPLAAVLDQGVEPEDRQVHRAAPVHPGPGGGDLLQQQGRLQDAEAATAVLLGDGHAQPAALGERLVERLREAARLVLLRPVGVGETRRQFAYGFPDGFLVLGELEIHVRQPALRSRFGYTAGNRDSRDARRGYRPGQWVRRGANGLVGGGC